MPEPVDDECRCEEMREHLYEFLDSEMSGSDLARLRRHIEECPTCREATDVETHIRMLLRRSCREVAPSTLRLRVITQIGVLRAGGHLR